MREFENSTHLYPSGWTRKPLDDLVNVDPESLKENFDPNSTFHYIDISAASEGKLVIPSTKITFRGAPSRARKVVERRDVLMSTVRPNLKAFAYFDHTDAFCVASTGFAILRAKDDTDARFILYTILSEDITSQIEVHVVGSNYPAITTGSVRRLSVLTPPSLEQRKIAKILSTIDNLIEKTQALIDKYQSIKQGMMHNLFTRGVDENGHLRPSYEEAPHLYKESELGWIPKEWDAGILRHYIGFLKSGLSRRIVEQDIGIPVMISGNIQDNKLDVSSLKYWYAKDPQGAKVENYILEDGDILLCFINSVDQIGKVCVYRNIGRPSIYTTNLFRIKSVDGVDSEFLYILLASSHIQMMIKSITKPAVNQASFTTGDFLGIKCKLVPSQEQERIKKRVLQCNRQINGQIDYLNKLQLIKSGLMQDLLTGKVRVKVDA